MLSKKIPLVALPAFADNGFGFGVGEVLDSLLGLQVELDPGAFVLGIDETEGVAAIAVHMPVRRRNAAVAHGDGHLMQGFGKIGPEIPVVFGATQVGFRVTLHGVVQVRELQRVFQKEHRRVVANQIPVAFFGIKFDRETANVPFGIRRAAFPGDGGEAHEEIGLLSDLGKNLRLGVLADVVGHGEGAEGPRTLGVHPPFGNDLPVEVGEFLQKPYILKQHRSTRSGGQDVLVVGHGGPGVGGQFLLLSHDSLLVGASTAGWGLGSMIATGGLGPTERCCLESFSPLNGSLRENGVGIPKAGPCIPSAPTQTSE